jgi:hypothetical protein
VTFRKKGGAAAQFFAIFRSLPSEGAGTGSEETWDTEAVERTCLPVNVELVVQNCACLPTFAAFTLVSRSQHVYST